MCPPGAEHLLFISVSLLLVQIINYQLSSAPMTFSNEKGLSRGSFLCIPALPGADPGIFFILGYDINTYKLLFKINR